MKGIAGILILTAALFIGCGGTSKTANRQMSDGERLFRANCRGCHVLPKPTAMSAEEWPEFISSHIDSDDLSPESKELISKHLQNLDDN